jgi:hypothetical protein
MTVFWSRSLKGVHGAWKTPGFAFLAPLLVELQPTFGVIFGIIAVFGAPQRGTWGTHDRPRALGLPFGRYSPGLVPFWSRFGPRSQPQAAPGGSKKGKKRDLRQKRLFLKAALFGARARTTVPPGHGTTPAHRPSHPGRVWATITAQGPPGGSEGLYRLCVAACERRCASLRRLCFSSLPPAVPGA